MNAATFSRGYLPPHVDELVDRSGIDAVLDECRHQHADALATCHDTSSAMEDLTKCITTSNAALLLGMGASHFVNQIAAARLRQLGVAAIAMPASEAIYATPPSAAGPVILASQSGGSAEIMKWLDARQSMDDIFGITLNAEGALAQRVPSLIGAGGSEKAFAATRSFAVSLALYAGLIAKLEGAAAAIPEREPDIHGDLATAVAMLDECKAIVVSARGSFEGFAGMMALGTMELARMPVLALEGGQFRHGPVEMLAGDVGVVIFRSAGASADTWSSILGICEEADAPSIIFDASGEEALTYGLTLRFEPGKDDLDTVYRMLPTQQALMIGLACARVPNAGVPRYCSKVTDEE